uniref:Uncharacterized protein n=1 Tax=Brassica campestris TaxID=3711 RepID=M4FBQ0_BRACM
MFITNQDTTLTLGIGLLRIRMLQLKKQKPMLATQTLNPKNGFLAIISRHCSDIHKLIHRSICSSPSSPNNTSDSTTSYNNIPTTSQTHNATTNAFFASSANSSSTSSVSTITEHTDTFSA